MDKYMRDTLSHIFNNLSSVNIRNLAETQGEVAAMAVTRSTMKLAELLYGARIANRIERGGMESQIEALTLNIA